MDTEIEARVYVKKLATTDSVSDKKYHRTKCKIIKASNKDDEEDDGNGRGRERVCMMLLLREGK